MRWYFGTRVFKRFYVGLSGRFPKPRPVPPGENAAAALKLLFVIAALVCFAYYIRRYG